VTKLLTYARVCTQGLVDCSKQIATEFQRSVRIDLDVYRTQLLTAAFGVEEESDAIGLSDSL
jgi:hypothetical protein